MQTEINLRVSLYNKVNTNTLQKKKIKRTLQSRRQPGPIEKPYGDGAIVFLRESSMLDIKLELAWKNPNQPNRSCAVSKEYDLKLSPTAMAGLSLW
jgi:hypothetical protein